MFPGSLTDTATYEWSVMRMRHGQFQNLHNITALLIGGERITNYNSFYNCHTWLLKKFKLLLGFCCRTYTHFCWVYLGVRTCELFLCFNTFCVDFFVSLALRQEMIGDVTWPFFAPFCNVSRLCGLPYSASKMFASKLCLSFCRQNFSKRNITCMKKELFT